MNEKIEIGQRVYGKPGLLRQSKNSEIAEGRVEKIFSNHIEVKFYDNLYQYRKFDFRQISDGATDFYLYFNKKDIYDDLELHSNIKAIKEIFDSLSPNPNLTVEKTRDILHILNGID